MHYYDKNKNGFSLIELLIVIAIIGVLAAIGWTNYQGLVNSVKKDTTIKNAEDIYRTLSTYSYKENYEIDLCNDVTSNETMLQCLKGLYATGGPFANKENPYDGSARIIEARNIANPHEVFHDPDTQNSNKKCSISGDASGVNGMIVITNDTLSSNNSFNLSVFYCSETNINDNTAGPHWTKVKNTIIWN